MEPPSFTPNWSSFEEFVSFLFAREVPTNSEKVEPWDHAFEYAYFEFDPEEVCSYYVRLFTKPRMLLARFSREQLEQGFWVIQGPNLACSVNRLLHDESSLPFARKVECIDSMFELFSQLFATEPLETSVAMWWDALCYDWHSGNRRREKGGEDAALQDAFFNVLTRILFLDSVVCQGAALHGLGHLHHPDTKKLIDSYLAAHPSLSKEHRDYALAAAEFKVR